MIRLLQLCGQLPLLPDLLVGLNPLTLEVTSSLLEM
jgi:hypothetical protein